MVLSNGPAVFSQRSVNGFVGKAKISEMYQKVYQKRIFWSSAGAGQFERNVWRGLLDIEITQYFQFTTAHLLNE
jgi:hypothetical protein